MCFGSRLCRRVSAHVRASELRNPNKYPLVVKYIGEIREEIQKKYEVTFEKHITELGRIRQEALSKGAFSAAANAEVARGKAAGLYIEQKIIRTGKLEDMSIEELEAKMKRIYDDNKVADRRRVYTWQRRVNYTANIYLAQRREHLLDKVSGQDPRTNTNVEISKNIEDKERNDEENRSI